MKKLEKIKGELLYLENKLFLHKGNYEELLEHCQKWRFRKNFIESLGEFAKDKNVGTIIGSLIAGVREYSPQISPQIAIFMRITAWLTGGISFDKAIPQITKFIGNKIDTHKIESSKEVFNLESDNYWKKFDILKREFDDSPLGERSLDEKDIEKLRNLCKDLFSEVITRVKEAQVEQEITILFENYQEIEAVEQRSLIIINGNKT